MTDAIRVSAQLHLDTCPGETRTFEQLVEYYSELTESSPFGPVIRMMEGTPSVLEMRSRRELATAVLDASIAKMAHLGRCLGLTFPYIMFHYGTRSNVRIDLSREDRVRIWISVTENSSNYSVEPYLDKSIDEFLAWFDLNVEEF